MCSRIYVGLSGPQRFVIVRGGGCKCDLWAQFGLMVAPQPEMSKLLLKPPPVGANSRRICCQGLHGCGGLTGSFIFKKSLSLEIMKGPNTSINYCIMLVLTHSKPSHIACYRR